MKIRYDLAAEKAREAIEELRLASYEQGYKDATHDLTANAPKTSQDIRDEIIEKAKRDVANLEHANALYGNSFDYITNKQKQTIVALVKIASSGKVVLRGISKCDPSDCFNVRIGKAIALRRALGLGVPAEYLNAPQPTEVRVGDVVYLKNAEVDVDVSERLIAEIAKQINDGIIKIIDDSRE
jgi:hypothetical protein